MESGGSEVKVTKTRVRSEDVYGRGQKNMYLRWGVKKSKMYFVVGSEDVCVVMDGWE